MANNNTTNLILTSIDSMVMWGRNNILQYSLDDLQNVSIQNNEETTDITGKNGRKIASLKQNKTVTITGANGVLSSGLLSAQTGGALEYTEDYPVSWSETIRVTNPDLVATSFRAEGFAGQEIRAIVRESNGGNIDTIHPLKQAASSPGEDEFTYDPETKIITFGAKPEAGELFRVYYTRKVAATHVDNPADKFSAEGYAVFDCTARDLCNNYYRSQLVVPRAELTGNFTMDIGTDQVLHNFEINALASVSNCDANLEGAASIYWDFIVFNQDAPDAFDVMQGAAGLSL